MWLDWGCEERGKEQNRVRDTESREGERGRRVFCFETLELWRGVFVLEQYNTWWRFA